MRPSCGFVADGGRCPARRRGFEITNERPHRLRQLRFARKCNRKFGKYVRFCLGKRLGFVLNGHASGIGEQCFKYRRNKSRCFRHNVLCRNFRFKYGKSVSNIRPSDKNRSDRHFKRRSFIDLCDGSKHNGNIGRNGFGRNDRARNEFGCDNRDGRNGFVGNRCDRFGKSRNGDNNFRDKLGFDTSEHRKFLSNITRADEHPPWCIGGFGRKQCISDA